MEWHDKEPIYRQLAEHVREQIRLGQWQEGQVLPSVRQVSMDLKINHLTVAKGYQCLVDEGLVEKRRGQGMFVCSGAQETLKSAHRQHFLEVQLPELATTLQQLNIDIPELVVHLRTIMERK
ncbi:GntR family transcriptional regulator [Vibrio zhugei]|uniref:GntR family transcriptional regulator n=1 Tax=Vibrio zhugei TaxID=2479546 RepID=A0ABV7CBS8_9VIBR|nr:GntR family transcriptional regulator [Vibrio zhugei]